MKKRSLFKLFLLNLLTLGFYEYVWLAQTNTEMALRYGVQAPKVRKLLFFGSLSTIFMVSILVIVLYFVPHYNKQLEAIAKPAPQCLVNYAEFSGQISQDIPSTLTQDCKQTVNTYYARQASVDKHMQYAIAAGFLSFIITSVASFYYYRWYQQYISAVTQVLGSSFASRSLLLGMYNAPVVTMLVIQNAFNKSGANSSAERLSALGIYVVASSLLAFILGMLLYFALR